MPTPRRTHCIRGHKLTEDNLYYEKRGQRRCLKCKRDYSRRRERTDRIRDGQQVSFAEPQKNCSGCGRELREAGGPHIKGTVVEFRDYGMCASCARHGPPRLSRELALIAVEMAREERWPVEPLEPDCRISDTPA